MCFSSPSVHSLLPCWRGRVDLGGLHSSCRPLLPSTWRKEEREREVADRFTPRFRLADRAAQGAKLKTAPPPPPPPSGIKRCTDLEAGGWKSLCLPLVYTTRCTATLPCRRRRRSDPLPCMLCQCRRIPSFDSRQRRQTARWDRNRQGQTGSDVAFGQHH